MRKTPKGTIEQILRSLDEVQADQVFTALIDAANYVDAFLQYPMQDRIIPLDDRIIILQQISEVEFFYVVSDPEPKYDELNDYLQRLASTMQAIFPEFAATY